VSAYLTKQAKGLEHRVYTVPRDIDEEVARLKLEAMGISIDRLTPEQAKYLADYQAGT
jgi:adenosylhomocysteinase